MNQETIHRFYEIEMYFAYNNMRNAYQFSQDPINNTIKFFTDTLGIDFSLFSPIFAPINRPSKRELIYFFIHQGYSYLDIRSFTGLSPNTISKYKKETQDSSFHLAPVAHNLWKFDQTEPRWNTIKIYTKLFHPQFNFEFKLQSKENPNRITKTLNSYNHRNLW
jgi:hypothetical protein